MSFEAGNNPVAPPVTEPGEQGQMASIDIWRARGIINLSDEQVDSFFTIERECQAEGLQAGFEAAVVLDPQTREVVEVVPYKIICVADYQDPRLAELIARPGNQGYISHPLNVYSEAATILASGEQSNFANDATASRALSSEIETANLRMVTVYPGAGGEVNYGMPIAVREDGNQMPYSFANTLETVNQKFQEIVSEYGLCGIANISLAASSEGMTSYRTEIQVGDETYDIDLCVIESPGYRTTDIPLLGLDTALGDPDLAMVAGEAIFTNASAAGSSSDLNLNLWSFQTGVAYDASIGGTGISFTVEDVVTGEVKTVTVGGDNVDMRTLMAIFPEIQEESVEGDGRSPIPAVLTVLILGSFALGAVYKYGKEYLRREEIPGVSYKYNSLIRATHNPIVEFISREKMGPPDEISLYMLGHVYELRQQFISQLGQIEPELKNYQTVFPKFRAGLMAKAESYVGKLLAEATPRKREEAARFLRQIISAVVDNPFDPQGVNVGGFRILLEQYFQQFEPHHKKTDIGEYNEEVAFYNSKVEELAGIQGFEYVQEFKLAERTVEMELSRVYSIILQIPNSESLVQLKEYSLELGGIAKTLDVLVGEGEAKQRLKKSASEVIDIIKLLNRDVQVQDLQRTSAFVFGRAHKVKSSDTEDRLTIAYELNNGQGGQKKLIHGYFLLQYDAAADVLEVSFTKNAEKGDLLEFSKQSEKILKETMKAASKSAPESAHTPVQIAKEMLGDIESLVSGKYLPGEDFAGVRKRLIADYQSNVNRSFVRTELINMLAEQVSSGKLPLILAKTAEEAQVKKYARLIAADLHDYLVEKSKANKKQYDDAFREAAIGEIRNLVAHLREEGEGTFDILENTARKDNVGQNGLRIQFIQIVNAEDEDDVRVIAVVAGNAHNFAG